MLISDYELEILYNLHILYLRQNKYDACLNIMSILEKNCGEKYDIFSSFGYLNEKGYIIGSDYDRFTARLKANYQPTSWFKQV